MAAGLPVIATDMGGNSDIVNDEAGCGMLVEYDNPDSMAVAMKCFLEDPAFPVPGERAQDHRGQV